MSDIHLSEKVLSGPLQLSPFRRLYLVIYKPHRTHLPKSIKRYALNFRQDTFKNLLALRCLNTLPQIPSCGQPFLSLLKRSSLKPGTFALTNSSTTVAATKTGRNLTLAIKRSDNVGKQKQSAGEQPPVAYQKVTIALINETLVKFSFQSGYPNCRFFRAYHSIRKESSRARESSHCAQNDIEH